MKDSDLIESIVSEIEGMGDIDAAIDAFLILDSMSTDSAEADVAGVLDRWAGEPVFYLLERLGRYALERVRLRSGFVLQVSPVGVVV